MENSDKLCESVQKKKYKLSYSSTFSEDAYEEDNKP